MLQSGYITSGEFKLQYDIEGNGIPLLIVGDNHYYKKVFSAQLRQHFQLVFVQHRGFASNPGIVEQSEYELDVIIEDIELCRRELQLNKFIMLGHSGHSYMALEYAKRYPQNVVGVVMIGISPDLSGNSHYAAQVYWEELAGDERKSILAKNKENTPESELQKLTPSKRFLKEYLINAPMIWYDPNFDASELFKESEFNMDMINYVWGTIFKNIDVTKNTENFVTPILLAVGKYDGIVAPVSSWESIKNNFQNMTIKVFEKSGHTPQYEEQEEFDKILIQWANDIIAN
jgi:proline iminopeptidase